MGDRSQVIPLHLRETPDLVALERSWRSALEQAERFVSERPPDEVDCLYYSRKRQQFVDRFDPEDDVVPHYGRPGGLIPSVDV